MKKQTLLTWIIISGMIVVGLFLYLLYLGSDYGYSKRLIKAIETGNRDEVVKIIESCPSCINTMPSKFTHFWHNLIGYRVALGPLNTACYVNDQEIIMLMVENGADVNCNDGYTPLATVYRGKQEGWYALSVFLIEKGACLNYKTSYSGQYSPVLNDILMPKPRTSSDFLPEDQNEVIAAFQYAVDNCDHEMINWVSVLCDSIS